MKKTILIIAAVSMMSFNVATAGADRPLNDSLLFQLGRVCCQLGNMLFKGISDTDISIEGIRTTIREVKSEDCQKVVLCTGVVASLLAYMNSDNRAFARNITWSPEATALAMTAASASVLTLWGDLTWADFYTKAGLSAMGLTVAAVLKHAYAQEQDEAYYQRLAKTLVTIIGPSALCAALASEPAPGRDPFIAFGAIGTFASLLAWLK